MKEEFRDVVGYEAYFMVSNLGKIYSKRTNRLLKLQYNKRTGYIAFSTVFGGKNGVAKCLKPHRLLAETFIPKVLGKLHVNHKDGDKTNNTITNLEWCTPSENSRHAWDTGLNKIRKNFIGDTINTTFTLSIRKEIYDIYDTDKFSMRELGRIYNCSHNVISRIIYRQGN